MSDRYWLVYNPDSSSPPRYRHTSEDSARKEAERLAAENRGQTFYVLEQRSAANVPRPDMTAEQFLASTRGADGLGAEWKTARVDELNEEVQRRLSSLDDVCIDMGEFMADTQPGQLGRRRKRDHDWVRQSIGNYVKAYEGGEKFVVWLDADWRKHNQPAVVNALLGAKQKFEELTGIEDTTIPF